MTAINITVANILRRQNACAAIRITWPASNGIQITNGQCYQVSFDVAGAAPNTTIYVTNVDLIDGSGNFVQTQWFGKIDPTAQSSTPYFNLNLGMNPVNGGNYAFQITALVNGQSCLINSVVFQGLYNTYSNAVRCP
ncbi:12878_t:CDS:2 [Ambispora leptoticha]|uniref:12878_t:CDS:1 n=1 Tax=Ambispora leptoticha TaxID=144679 RepID=A0A9N9BHU1_9GLOM|nr:12878_t:CDS:2 [Ambispora leptoticha]